LSSLGVDAEEFEEAGEVVVVVVIHLDAALEMFAAGGGATGGETHDGAGAVCSSLMRTTENAIILAWK
jgi:hypothetical protein